MRCSQYSVFRELTPYIVYKLHQRPLHMFSCGWPLLTGLTVVSLSVSSYLRFYCTTYLNFLHTPGSSATSGDTDRLASPLIPSLMVTGDSPTMHCSCKVIGPSAVSDSEIVFWRVSANILWQHFSKHNVRVKGRQL